MVVLMHGFGAPGEEPVPLPGKLRSPATCVLPFGGAPGVDMVQDGRAWWHIDMVERSVRSRNVIRNAHRTGASRLVELERRYPSAGGAARDHGVTREKLVLGASRREPC